MWNLSKNKTNEAFVFKTNILSDEEIKAIREHRKGIKLEKAKVFKDQLDQKNPRVDQVAIRKSEICWLPEVEFTSVYQKITGAIIELNDAFYGYDLTYFESIQFTEYEKTGFYDYHTDDGYDMCVTRKMSFSLLLSDPATFTGGDLQFLRFDNKVPIVAPRTYNTIVMFPSDTLHCVTPVAAGMRNSLVSWINGPSFK